MRAYLYITTLLLPLLSDAVQTPLDGVSYNAFVSSKQISLVLFTATGCAACDEVGALLEAVHPDFPKTPVGTVNCAEEPSTCDEALIFEAPTLMLSLGDGSVVRYKDRWEASSIARFLKRQYGPTVIEMRDLTEDVSSNPTSISIVAFLADDDETSSAVFREVAIKWRAHYSFALITNVSVAMATEVSQPAIVIFKPFDERKSVYQDAFLAKDIESFIETNTRPLIEEMDHVVYEHHVKNGIPLAHILSSAPEERYRLAELLYPLANRVRGRVAFVTVNTMNYPKKGETLALGENSMQGFAIEDVRTTRAYPMLGASFAPEDIIEFTAKYLEGNIEPVVRSDDISLSSTESPLVTLVGRNFESFVFDTSRDILVEFSVPWCQYCVQLHTKMSELGAKYKELGLSSKVALAKIDVSTNDVPARITEYPTLKVYRATTNDVVDFDGAFHELITVEELATFIRDVGMHGIDAVPDNGAASRLIADAGHEVVRDEL